MDIGGYLAQVQAQFQSGQATEHSYRPALAALFRSIDPALTIINEPKRGDAGMVDFLFLRGDVPIGWCEAKDVDKDVIRLKGYSVEQRKRYEKAYPNLIYTNGVDFEFIRDGTQVHFVSIADFLMGLQPNPDKYDELARQLKLFAEAKPISITSAAKLAEMMAAKAAIIKDEVGIALKDDPEFRTGLGGQYKSFKTNLLPALEPDEFADIYAETITYGMFAARFHDDDLTTFSRAEALEKLPASNPFLKGLFEYVAGPALPKRLTYIVDDLVQVMRASDPHSLFRDFGKFTARNDPFVHFYEDFLAAYNPKKRRSRGVWYTPEPVVDFIVRAVDDVLKTEFGLADGLADTSKVTVDWDTGQDGPGGKPRTIKKEVHKVQILDPATGTGTFLAKTVQLIADRVKARAPGKWSGYVEADLLPRLHGFELLMASYAMCHMKLDMQLTESGYKPSANPPRLSVWLTNALEPAEREVRDLFFQPLAEEARGASEVKRQTPIMCVIGNPPYSGESANKGKHIMDLMEAYKKEPGGKEKLKERNPKWINDDYVKFIRMAEDVIAKNPSGGVLGFITNHGYLDNPTFRGMRWHLLKTFDKIWVLDLHGSTKKAEIAPDGSADENVFDILPGVSVIIAAKWCESKSSVSSVHRGDIWGKRSLKNEALLGLDLSNLDIQIEPQNPHYLFTAKDYEQLAIYDACPSIQSIFSVNVLGFQTHRDDFAVAMSREEIRERLSDMASIRITDDEFKTKYRVSDNRDWKLTDRRRAVMSEGSDSLPVHEVAYRPFDTRFASLDYFTMDYPRTELIAHLRDTPNLSLAASRQQGSVGFQHAIAASNAPNDCLISSKSREANQVFPLYLYPESSNQSDAFTLKHRTPNLDPKLYAAICAAAGIDPADQAGPDDDFRAASGDARPSEVKVFDYIYGVLHSPDYRRTYAEFLKIDFPRIPYPASPEVFAHVSEKGEALRRLHLMESAAIGDTLYPYLGEGDDVVAKGFPKFESAPAEAGTANTPSPKSGRVFINPDQYFDAVPEIAWGFHIGGYQPAQKWLKDRRGRTLSWDDIGHYQKIIKILTETDRIMKEIELPL